MIYKLILICYLAIQLPFDFAEAGGCRSSASFKSNEGVTQNCPDHFSIRSKDGSITTFQSETIIEDYNEALEIVKSWDCMYDTNSRIRGTIENSGNGLAPTLVCTGIVFCGSMWGGRLYLRDKGTIVNKNVVKLDLSKGSSLLKVDSNGLRAACSKDSKVKKKIKEYMLANLAENRDSLNCNVNDTVKTTYVCDGYASHRFDEIERLDPRGKKVESRKRVDR